MSLKKHSYYHKACVHHCLYFDKTFPFLSQKTFHKRIHTNTTCHRCSREGCSSSFSRQSDLKSHLLLHDSPPIKCTHCEYTNTDIRHPACKRNGTLVIELYQGNQTYIRNALLMVTNCALYYPLRVDVKTLCGNIGIRFSITSN